jgi:hypothetical protein
VTGVPSEARSVVSAMLQVNPKSPSALLLLHKL